MSDLRARVMELLKNKKSGMEKREIYKRIQPGKRRAAELYSLLDSLAAEGVLTLRRQRYILPAQQALVPAVIVKVSRTFGFAAPEAGGRDYFIPGRELRGAMPGDQVLLRPRPGQGELPEALVASVTRRVDTPFSGTAAQDEQGNLFVQPDRFVSFPIYLAPGSQAKPGEKITAVVAERGERHSGHTAKLLEVHGSSQSASVCAKAILRENAVPLAFSPEALEQAAALAAGTGIHPKELEGRLDLRGETIFTIDGADAKDLDDAVSLTKTENGWSLGVHIADVSYFVTSGSPLDKDAYERGTSVYYADQVVPMLPPELSNGICSLHPDEDRLTFSALIELDENAAIRSCRFVKSVIRSRVKGVYDEVNQILAGNPEAGILQKYAGLEAVIGHMAELAERLVQNRTARGSVNLETVESKIFVGPDGKTADVQPRSRGRAERVIEEFMLTANEAAALFAKEHSLPFVYRVHEPPAPDKLEDWKTLMGTLGVKIPGRKKQLSPGDIAAVVAGVRGTPKDAVVNTMTLRMMSKAKYAPENTGHFGLALDDYAQFTSPIRRYPDLAIHRIMSGFVTGMRRDNIEKRFRKWTPLCAAQSSARELAAMSAERACEDCYKAEYMTGHIGDAYDGVISGVTAFGLFVRLPSTVEGFLELTQLPGSWSYDSSAAVTSRDGKKISLGDSISVICAAADVSAGKVTFALAQEASPDGAD